MCGLIGSAGGREVVGGIAAHLVQIDDDVREPLEHRADAAARLRLRLREPVAVHVEQVVVRAAAGPRLVVFRGKRVRVGDAAAWPMQVVDDEARAPVRVLHRIDHDDRIAAGWLARRRRSARRAGDRLPRAPRRTTKSRCRARRASARSPPEARARADRASAWREPARIREPAQVGLHTIQLPRCAPATPITNSHSGRPSHVLAYSVEPRPLGRRLVQRAKVDRNLFRRRDLLAVVVPEDLLDGRDLWRRIWLPAPGPASAAAVSWSASTHAESMRIILADAGT